MRMALTSEGVSTPFFKSASSNAVTLTALVAEAGFGAGLGLESEVAAAVPTSAPVALGAFPFAVPALLFCATMGPIAMARMAKTDRHTLSFRMDGLTFSFQIDIDF